MQHNNFHFHVCFACVFTKWPAKLAIFTANPDLLGCCLAIFSDVGTEASSRESK